MPKSVVNLILDLFCFEFTASKMTIVQLSNGDGGHYASARTSITSTDVLIVGTGPAGASLACFLASYGEWDLLGTFKCSNARARCQKHPLMKLGIRGIMISAAPTNADTPRAHITNMAAMGKLFTSRILSSC